MGISLPFYPLAFVHGYVDGVSLSISMIWFSLSGGGLGKGREWGVWEDGFAVYLSLKAKEMNGGNGFSQQLQKNALLLQDSHNYVERREALDPKARESN